MIDHFGGIKGHTHEKKNLLCTNGMTSYSLYLAPAERHPYTMLVAGSFELSGDAMVEAMKDAARRFGSWPWRMHDGNSMYDNDMDTVTVVKSEMLDALSRNLEAVGVRATVSSKRYIRSDPLNAVQGGAWYKELKKMGFNLYLVDDMTHTLWRLLSEVSSRSHPAHAHAQTHAQQTHTGAGVLLLEVYNDKRTRPIKTGNAFILFQGLDGKYEEAGGGRESGETPKATAMRELKEESVGLFRIGLDQGRVWSYEVAVHNGMYRVFVVPITSARGIARSGYDANLAVSRRSQHALPHAWQETKAMTRVFVSDLVAANLLGAQPDVELRVHDVYGEQITVSARATAAMRKAVNEMPGSIEWNVVTFDDRMTQRGIGVVGSPVYNKTLGQTKAYFIG